MPDFLTSISSATTLEALDALRVQYLGKSGVITEQLKNLGKLGIPENFPMALTALEPPTSVLRPLRRLLELWSRRPQSRMGAATD